MSATSAEGPRVEANPRFAELRRRLIVAASAVTVLAVIHHADHVIRGDLTLARRLDPTWNHSGWPFQDPVTPFTASLAVYLLLVGGIVLTVRGRLWAGYWLVTAVLLAAIVTFVHFLGPNAETPSVIYRTHESAAAGVLALLDLLALGISLIVLGLEAIRARRISGRWQAPRLGDQSLV